MLTKFIENIILRLGFFRDILKENKKLKEDVEYLENELLDKELPIIFFNQRIKNELSLTEKDYKEIQKSYREAGKFMIVLEKIILSEIKNLVSISTNIYTDEKERFTAICRLDSYKRILVQITEGKFSKEKEKEEKKENTQK